ncbi:unnamed protein product [Acanthoscelides obtectus]|uniref:Uncharacterized protein n=1 Tax=Acanthoscelides obtectus TaxID=200917 RepID=A0A9P0P0Z5_ACAOB|nr:unnamed protein product [Acanthoscelides obtectus]CAK1640679.1 hypothetical protein AOBTE_LOCUS11870 [Acanthoscelides obtectus]
MRIESRSRKYISPKHRQLYNRKFQLISRNCILLGTFRYVNSLTNDKVTAQV